jgi:hypothetical protein
MAWGLWKEEYNSLNFHENKAFYGSELFSGKGLHSLGLH